VTQKKDDLKPMAMAGSGIMNLNQGMVQKPYPSGGYDSKQGAYGV
jgi:hypothetical protein